MSRFAKAGVTKEDLKKKIDDAGGSYEVVYFDKIQKDIKKIEFDCENTTDPNDEEDGGFDMPGFIHGYDVLSTGVAVCWIGAGGDWEMPLAFCIYIGDDGSLRAYVPKDGNCYNFETKRAIGNWSSDDDDDWGCADHEEELKHLGIEYKFDMDKLRADAANRIVFK